MSVENEMLDIPHYIPGEAGILETAQWVPIEGVVLETAY